MDRDEAIKRIRYALRQRSGKQWSVTGGRGTAYGWIKIQSPPARQTRFGMTDADQAELSALLGKPVHHQGESVPASGAYRIEAVSRAETGKSDVIGTPYWD